MAETESPEQGLMFYASSDALNLINRGQENAKTPKTAEEKADQARASAQALLSCGPATRGFGYCCQIFEMGDFHRIAEAARTLAINEDGGVDDERVLELTTQSILSRCGGLGNVLATTEPEQKVAAKALPKAGFKKIARFPGVRNRTLTLWLRVRVVRKEEEK